MTVKKKDSDNLDLFAESGGSFFGETTTVHVGEGGSSPTPPLQISVKSIRLQRIPMNEADAYSIRYHYLHRTAKNSKIAFGIFAEKKMRGIMIWGLPVARIKGQFGDTWTQLELRRMFCDDSLPKNSESRCLAMAARILKKLFPNCKVLVAYSDLSNNHRGIIYKAAGWRFVERIEADKDGGWSKHTRHKRVEHGDKFKWVLPLNG